MDFISDKDRRNQDRIDLKGSDEEVLRIMERDFLFKSDNKDGKAAFGRFKMNINDVKAFYGYNEVMSYMKTKGMVVPPATVVWEDVVHEECTLSSGRHAHMRSFLIGSSIHVSGSNSFSPFGADFYSKTHFTGVLSIAEPSQWQHMVLKVSFSIEAKGEKPASHIFGRILEVYKDCLLGRIVNEDIIGCTNFIHGHRGQPSHAGPGCRYPRRSRCDTSGGPPRSLSKC